MSLVPIQKKHDIYTMKNVGKKSTGEIGQRRNLFETHR